MTQCKAKSKEKDAKLLENLAVEARQRLAYEQPSEAVFPGRASSIDQYGSHTMRSIIVSG